MKTNAECRRYARYALRKSWQPTRWGGLPYQRVLRCHLYGDYSREPVLLTQEHPECQTCSYLKALRLTLKRGITSSSVIIEVISRIYQLNLKQQLWKTISDLYI